MALEKKIQNLLATRTELAERLSNLEAMKAETNNRVYSKIKADYDGQLNTVLGKLGDEKGSLEDKVSDLSERISKLEEKHQNESDVVEELQIRARLREHDENDSAFQSELGKATSARSATGDELDGLRTELGDMKKVLKDVEDATEGKGVSQGKVKTKATPLVDQNDLDELDLDEDLDFDTEDEDDDRVKCPTCSHMNPPQKLFCEDCGAALDEDESLDDDFDLLDDGDLDL